MKAKYIVLGLFVIGILFASSSFVYSFDGDDPPGEDPPGEDPPGEDPPGDDEPTDGDGDGDGGAQPRVGEGCREGGHAFGEVVDPDAERDE